MLTEKDNEILRRYGIGQGGMAPSGAPLTMTDEEMAQAEKSQSFQPVTESRIEPTAQGKKPNFFSNVADVIGKEAGGFKNTLTEAADASGRTQTPLESVAQTGLGFTGAVARTAFGTAMEAGKEILKPETEFLKNATPEFLKKGIEDRLNQIKDFGKKELLLPIVKPWLQLAKDEQSLHPVELERVKRDGRAIMDLLDTVATAEGAGAAKKAAAPLVSEAVSTADAAVRQTVPKVVRAANAVTEAGANKAIDEGIAKGIKPYFTGTKTAAAREGYVEKAKQAVRTIVEEKPVFTNAEGIAEARLPKTRAELLDAIGQAKKKVYDKYHGLAVQAGEAGAVFNPDGVVRNLKTAMRNKALSPEVREYARKMIPDITELRLAKPDVIEARIADLNQSLTGLYEGRVSKAKAQLDASVANLMRSELDANVENATGKAYQAVKDKYGALKTIEKDVARQVAVEARKNPKGLVDLTDIFTGGDLVAGAITANPALIAKGIAGRAGKELIKRLNDPNRFIERMFKAAEKIHVPEARYAKGPGASGADMIGKEVLPAGGPKATLYHGSKENFDKFDNAKFGSGEGSGLFGKGAYLTDSEKVADFYASHVAKKDFVERTAPSGIFGTEEPVFAKEADALAEERKVINKFSSEAKVLDADTFKLDKSLQENLAKSVARERGMDVAQAEKYVKDLISYARRNKEKISGFRGELPWAVEQIAINDPKIVSVITDYVKKLGYDGIKYANDASFGGTGNNFFVFNTEKLKKIPR